jgi:hypothetical protein
MGKYLDIVRKFEASRAGSLPSAAPPAPVSPSGWPCELCGKPAEIEAIEPSLDEHRMLTYWHCEPCQTWGVTPGTLREPPVWVRKSKQ